MSVAVLNGKVKPTVAPAEASGTDSDAAVATARALVERAREGLAAALAELPEVDTEKVAEALLRGDNPPEADRKASERRAREWQAAVTLAERRLGEAEEKARMRLRRELTERQKPLLEAIAKALLPLLEAVRAEREHCRNAIDSGVGMETYGPLTRLDFRDCNLKTGTFSDAARWAKECREAGLLPADLAQKLGATV